MSKGKLTLAIVILVLVLLVGTLVSSLCKKIANIELNRTNTLEQYEQLLK